MYSVLLLFIFVRDPEDASCDVCKWTRPLNTQLSGEPFQSFTDQELLG